MTMDRSKIAELLRPYAALDPRQLAATSIYIDLVLKWNSRINLTAVRRPEEIVTRHFGESFFAAIRLLAPDATNTMIDLGSGAGFPGLPLAILVPRVQVTLIESSGKKAAFLHEVIRALDLRNAQVFLGRGEDYPGKASLVVMRAVEKFEEAIKLAVTLVGPPGRLALMIGRGQVRSASDLTLELAWKQPIDIPGGHSRVLLVGIKAVKVG